MHQKVTLFLLAIITPLALFSQQYTLDYEEVTPRKAPNSTVVPTLQSQGANGRSRAVCGTDTLRYVDTKNMSGNFLLLNVQDTASAQGVYQSFEAPQNITVRGSTVHIRKFDAPTGSVTPVAVNLYAADPVTLVPTGAPLRTDTVFAVNTLFVFPAQFVLYADWAPIVMSQPYAIAVEKVPGSNDIQPIAHANGDGQGEFLSGARFGANWTRGDNINLGATNFDTDFLIYPYVSYSMNPGFTIDPPCYIGFGLYTFFNNANSVLNHRMYNQNIANNLPDSSFTWDFGDGSAPTTQNNLGSQGHLYLPNINPPFNISLTGTVLQWNGKTCTETSIQVLEDRPTPGWEFTANGFTLTFTDTSSGNLSNVSWTFDDGTSSTFLDPVHTFPGPGNYYVCQTWDSPCGPLQTCKSIGISQPKTLLCGKDEVGFTQARATEYDSLTVGQGAGADADLVGQLFRAPQSIVVHGFTFYASHNSNADSAFRVNAYLYNASNVGLIDTLIASTTLRVDRSRELVFQGATQPNPVRMTAYNATFRAPVEVNSDYVVAIEPNTISEISILTNRWRAAMPSDQDGNGDGFSLINEGVNWTKGLNVQPDGSFAFDADFIFEPLVEYSLNANFDKDPECIETPALVTFNNLSAPILLDPMYNVNAFNNNTEASFVWEFGDTLNNPQNVINPLHSYTQDGPFEVSMEVTMNGWTTSCMNAQVDSVFSLPIPDFNIIQAPGFNTVIFQNTSVNATEYLWSFGDGGFSNSISPTHFYQTVDSFTVCLAASNQCDARQICKSVVVVIVGIPELPGLENLTVYPNPARDNVYVAANLNVPTDLTIELLDLTGRVLNSIHKPGAMAFEQPIDISGLAKGTYLVRVNNGQESIVKKISILE